MSLDHFPSKPNEAIANLGLNPSVLSGLTREQADQQIDLALRLLGMAVSGAPTTTLPRLHGQGIDLALHALLTAYMSLADAYELNTVSAALLASEAGLQLAGLHARRAARAPSQIQ
jgi:hypothetical protein